MMENETLYEDCKEFAKRMKTPESTIRMMCTKHMLPSFKLGRKWMIDVNQAMAEFSQQIKERQNEVPKPKPEPVIVKPIRTGNYLDDLKALIS